MSEFDPPHPTRFRGRGVWLTRALSLAVAIVMVGGCASFPTSGQRAEVAPVVEVPPPTVPAPTLAEPVDPAAYYHYLRGHRMEIERQYDKALSAYLAALTYLPNSRVLLSRTAFLYFQNGDLLGAIETAERALTHYPDDAQLLHFLSSLYLKQRNYAMAERTYKHLISQNPADTKPYYLLILSYLREERFDDARVLLAQARERDPKSGLADYYMGRILRAEGKNRQAMRSYRKAVRKDPQLEAAYLEQANLWEVEGKPDKAAELYEQVLVRANPYSPYARDGLIRIYLASGQRERVLVQYDALVAQNPRNPNVLYRRALLLAELDRLDESVDSASRILSFLPADENALELLASLYERQGRYQKARTTLGRLLELNPESVSALTRVGYLAHQMGDDAGREEIVDQMEELLTEHADDISMYLFISWGHTQAKRYEAAVDILQKAMAVDGKNIQVHFTLGVAYYELQRFDDMIHEMLWVVEQDPNHANALNFLGYTYADEGINLDQAVVYINRALAIRPDDGLFLDSLAWAYYKQGKFKKALKVQTKAIRMAPEEDAILYDHLGGIYLGMGRLDKARGAWRQALTLDPETDKLRERYVAAGFGDPDLSPTSVVPEAP